MALRRLSVQILVLLVLLVGCVEPSSMQHGLRDCRKTGNQSWDEWTCANNTASFRHCEADTVMAYSCWDKSRRGRSREPPLRRGLARVFSSMAGELSADQLVDLADEAADMEDWPRCLTWTREARKHAPLSWRLVDLEATAMAELGDVDAALVLYGESHNLGGPDAALCAARVAYTHGKLDAAAVFIVLGLDQAQGEHLREIFYELEDDLQVLAMREDVQAALPRARARARRPHA